MLVDLSTYDGTFHQHWLEDYDLILCIAPITLSVRLLDWLPNLAGTRAVFLSSNNAALQTQDASYDPIRAAEDRILKSGLNAIILHPTAISGRPGDRVLGRLIHAVQSRKPMILPGTETRQSLVDYRDVARAMRLAANPEIPTGTYSVNGPDQMTYRNILRAVESTVGRSARIIDIPPGPLRLIGRFITQIPELRRAGIHRDPVHPPLPGYHAEFSVADMVATLTRTDTIPS